MKALGILVNIIHSPSNIEQTVYNQGSNIVSAMVSLLTENPSDEIREQVLCVLVNFCSLSVKGCDLLTASDNIMRCLSELLVSMIALNS